MKFITTTLRRHWNDGQENQDFLWSTPNWPNFSGEWYCNILHPDTFPNMDTISTSLEIPSVVMPRLWKYCQNPQWFDGGHGRNGWYFNRLRRVPPATMEKGYPANQQPLHWPSKNMAVVKTLALALTHFLCQKCFCGKEGLEAKTLVSFKARFKFKTKAYV